MLTNEAPSNRVIAPALPRGCAAQRLAALVLSVALFAVFLPAQAGAVISIQNWMEGESTATTGPQFFDYGQATKTTFDLTADFGSGTYVDTEMDGTGTFLQLAGAGSAPAGWWNANWGARRCFKVDNPGAALTEHQVRIELDTTGDITAGLVQADGADYRAIASDNTTQLDLWVEGPMNSTQTVIWVQVDIPAGGEKFCLYFDNSTATTVSSEAAVFTYTAPRQLYYTANWRFNGSTGTSGQLAVVSFVDANTVSVDGVSQVLNTGQSHTFTNVTADSVILVNGPIAGRGVGGGMDALIPVSYAGEDLVFPTNRHVNRFTLVAPLGGTATVDIYNGTTLAWSGNVGASSVSPTVDISNNRSATIRSTNGVPIIVTHAATSGHDAATVPPFFAGDDIYGVRSRYTNIGVFQGPASLDIFRSDGTTQTLTGLAAGSETTIVDAADLDGDGTAIRLTNMSGFTGSFQQADRDGNEITAFLPERLLESEYYLSTAAQYIAFSCPTTMTITVGATAVPCTSPGAGFPGHGITGATPAGTRIFTASGDEFYAYYEDAANNDETNLFGMKSAQAAAPVVLPLTAGNLEVLPASATSGTWTSPTIDTLATGTNVFGLLETATTAPTGTTVSFQIATGPTAAAAAAAPFVGPDATAGTTWTAAAPLPYGMDFTDQFVIVRASLATTTAGVTPQVDAVSVGYDLPEIVANPGSHAIVTNGAVGDTDWVARVWVEDPAFAGATAMLTHQNTTGATAASNARVRTDTTAQIYLTSGTITQGFGPAFGVGPGLPHSILVDTEAMVGAQMDITWEARISGAGIIVQHQLQLNFS